MRVCLNDGGGCVCRLEEGVSVVKKRVYLQAGRRCVSRLEEGVSVGWKKVCQ
jgi:hypothetical protein